MDLEETNNTATQTAYLSKGEMRRRAKEKAIQKAKLKKALPWVVFVLVIVGGIYWIILSVQKKEMNRPGESVAVQGGEHLAPGEVFNSYNSNPPTSGPHTGPVPWGFSEKELPDENVIHNLEHGGIWITYKNLDEESINKLRDIAKQNSLSVVVSPRVANDTPVALASWGRLETMDTVDIDAIQTFIQANKNKSPERLVR